MNVYGFGPFWGKKDFGSTLNYLFLKAAKVALEERKELGDTEEELFHTSEQDFALTFNFDC